MDHSVGELLGFWACRCLNDKVKGFGSIWSVARAKFNHHLANKGIHVFIGRERKRKKRIVNRRDFTIEVDEFFDSMVRQEMRDRLKLRHCFQTLKIKVRNLILKDRRFENWSRDDKLMLNKWREYRVIEKIDGKFKQKTDFSKRMLLKLKFDSKWMEKVYLSNIFNTKEIKDSIPSQCRLRDPPLVVFTYRRNIGSFILNYNRVLKDLEMEEFSELEDIE
jgi:hypothetical protein